MVTEQQLNLTGGVIAMNSQLMVELIMLILQIILFLMKFI